jgi:hypothetical protein
LLDFNAKADMEDIFKPTTGNDSLDEISNDCGVRVLNLATSKKKKKSHCQKCNVPTS